MSNGMTPNPNRMSQKGMSVNRMSPNRMSPNRMSPNEISPNRMIPGRKLRTLEDDEISVPTLDQVQYHSRLAMNEIK